jgi:hypothetical protein
VTGSGFDAAVLVGTTLVGLNDGGLQLRRFNTLTHASTDINLPVGPSNPSYPAFDLAASPNGAQLYVIGYESGSTPGGNYLQVIVYNTFTWTVTATADLTSLGLVQGVLGKPTVDPSTGDLWIPLESGVAVVDPTNWSAQIILGGNTGQVAFDGPDAWVPMPESGLVEVDTADKTIVQTVVGAAGYAAVAAPDGNDVYVAAVEPGPYEGTALHVLAVATTSEAVDDLGAARPEAGPFGFFEGTTMAIAADGSTVFLGSNVTPGSAGGLGEGFVTTVDATTNTITDNIAIVTEPTTVTALVPSPGQPPATQGYWEAAADGGIFSFGNADYFGSMGGKSLNRPIVGLAGGPANQGYWEVASDGGIFAFGDAAFYGSMGGRPLNAPVVAMAATPDGRGYWEAASDGGIFAFGDAGYYGSMGGVPLNQPVVSIASTPDGKGYWMVAADGGIFAFGDAIFHGSMGGVPTNAPVVGMVVDESTGGYWMVGADGGVFAFDAPFLGSASGSSLALPALGLTPSGPGPGYWVEGADGGLVGFGSAGNYGSMGGIPLNAPMVGMASTELVV